MAGKRGAVFTLSASEVIQFDTYNSKAYNVDNYFHEFLRSFSQLAS